jgi:hypothetical protein
MAAAPPVGSYFVQLVQQQQRCSRVVNRMQQSSCAQRRVYHASAVARQLLAHGSSLSRLLAHHYTMISLPLSVCLPAYHCAVMDPDTNIDRYIKHGSSNLLLHNKQQQLRFATANHACLACWPWATAAVARATDAAA